MPHASDKIIINGNRDKGNNAAIEAEFDSLNVLGAEIVERGLSPQTVAFRDEMIPACKKYNKAQAEYLDFLRDFTDKLAAWLDSQP